jgi:hypothetical protein
VLEVLCDCFQFQVCDKAPRVSRDLSTRRDDFASEADKLYHVRGKTNSSQSFHVVQVYGVVDDMRLKSSRGAIEKVIRLCCKRAGDGMVWGPKRGQSAHEATYKLAD